MDNPARHNLDDVTLRAEDGEIVIETDEGDIVGTVSGDFNINGLLSAENADVTTLEADDVSSTSLNAKSVTVEDEPVEDNDVARLSEVEGTADDPHANEAHSETFAVDGDTQPPQPHDNEAHDRDFVDESEASDAAPVQSVNGQTGDVETGSFDLVASGVVDAGMVDDRYATTAHLIDGVRIIEKRLDDDERTTDFGTVHSSSNVSFVLLNVIEADFRNDIEYEVYE